MVNNIKEVYIVSCYDPYDDSDIILGVFRNIKDAQELADKTRIERPELWECFVETMELK